MMFINAEPRFVSNGFETFVLFHRAEALHQRLVEMTNNDANAWSIFRPVVPSTGDGWDGHLDEYNNNENFQVHSLYGGYYPEASSIAQNQVPDLPRTVAYSQAHQPEYQTFKPASTSQPLYQEPVPEMNCFERPSPMLGNDYSQMSLGRGRGSFAEFSSVRNVLKNLSSQPQVDTGDSSLTSSSGVHQSTYGEEVSDFTPTNMTNISPNTVYSSYIAPQTSASHPTVGSTDTRNSSMSTTKAHCWQGTLRSGRGNQNTYELPMGFDGLPKYQYDPWGSNSGSGSASAWDPQSLASNTISPKMLTLNVSNASLSSSHSSPDSVLALSESSAAMSVDDPGEPPVPERLEILAPQPVRRPRQTLPDCPPSSRRIVPVVPSNDFPPSRNTKKRPMKGAKSSSQIRRKSSPPVKAPLATFHSPSPSPQGSDADSPRAVATPQRIEPKLVEPESPRQAFAAAEAMRDRDAKDDFLVRSKLAGMSYKDIRRVGNFPEAESTLRGRFRTLTKDKKQRVRKPEWEDNDIRLLKKAVRKLTRESDLSKGKIPWKQVAEYIANHGGSYHFGNSTCRKRWDELTGKDR